MLALSAEEFNRFGLCLAAPIMQGGTFDRLQGFGVPLSGSGTATQGIVMCAQLRVLSYKERGARFVERVPGELIFDPATQKFETFKSSSSSPSVRQIHGRKGEVWTPESAADKLVVYRYH